MNVRYVPTRESSIPLLLKWGISIGFLPEQEGGGVLTDVLEVVASVCEDGDAYPRIWDEVDVRARSEDATRVLDEAVPEEAVLYPEPETVVAIIRRRSTARRAS